MESGAALVEGGPLFSRSCKDANAVQQRLLLAASFGSAGLLRLPDSSRLSPDLQIFLLCAADCQPFSFLRVLASSDWIAQRFFLRPQVLRRIQMPLVDLVH